MDNSFKFECEYCLKKYVHSQGRSKHYKICISKIQYEASECEKRIDFGDEQTSHLTDDVILSVLEHTPPKRIITTIVEMIWNSKKHMNVKIMGQARNKCFILERNTWVPVDKLVLANQIIERIANIIFLKKSTNDRILRKCVYYPADRANYKQYVNILHTDKLMKHVITGRPQRLKDMQDSIIKYFATMDYSSDSS